VRTIVDAFFVAAANSDVAFAWSFAAFDALFALSAAFSRVFTSF
jgi:hypothetical protein